MNFWIGSKVFYYSNCPEDLVIIEKNKLYAKVIQVSKTSNGGLNSLIVPAKYWHRFSTDEQFKKRMIGSFSKHVFTEDYPEKEVLLGGKPFRDTVGMARPGVIPDTTPVFTKYPYCPAGYLVEKEAEDSVTLYCAYQAGMMGGRLVVPAELWERFTEDKGWRNKMTRKYARMLELDSSEFSKKKLEAITDLEKKKTGVIPLYEGN